MSTVKRYVPTPVTWKKNRGWLFYLFLLPLFFAVVFALFSLQIKALLLNSIAFILMYITMKVAMRGFVQEEKYNNSKLTKAPKIPYKQLASYLLGGTVFYTATIAGNYGLFEGLFLAGISVLGFWLYYGFDPRKDKLKDFGDISSELVLKMLNETEEKIETIAKNAKKVEEHSLKRKIDLAVEKSQAILDALVDDPQDIRVARKFLVVYLDGVSEVIEAYNRVDKTHLGTETRENLFSLMDEVEKKFEKELKRLKANNAFDLDVNIETLKEQIKH